MSNEEQLQKDHERLRTILKNYVEDILARQPELAKGRWEFECYRSIDVFEKTFPSPERRRQILDALDAHKGAVDEAVQWASEETRDLGEKVEREIKRRHKRHKRKEGDHDFP